MSTVIFEIEKAIFHLNLRDVFASLQDYSSCGRVKDAADLVNILEASSSEPKSIPSEKGFFGYILLDLFSKNKGSVFCKVCQKTYPAKEVLFHRIGFGDNPLAVNQFRKGGILGRIFGRKIKRVRMMGGKGFRCPEGHELSSMITWIS